MKKSSLAVSSILIAVMLFLSCGETSNENREITKRNLESSTEVTIGEQVWMTQNLNVDKFRNGDPIPEAKTDGEWEAYGNAGEAAWCYYDNDPKNGEKYGRVYNWFAVNDSRGLAPSGSHIPTNDEWEQLIDYLGGLAKAGAKMKSKSGWNEDGNGTNSSGFSALPSGTRTIRDKFIGIGSYGNFWTYEERDNDGAWGRGLDNESSTVIRNYNSKADGLSVRCLRD
jgi:uncharacterized protein (TIGR02145 family)